MYHPSTSRTYSFIQELADALEEMADEIDDTTEEYGLFQLFFLSIFDIDSKDLISSFLYVTLSLFVCRVCSVSPHQ